MMLVGYHLLTRLLMARRPVGALPPPIVGSIIMLVDRHLSPLFAHDWCTCVDVATEYLYSDPYVAVCPVSDFPLHLAGWEGFVPLF